MSRLMVTLCAWNASPDTLRLHLGIGGLCAVLSRFEAVLYGVNSRIPRAVAESSAGSLSDPGRL